MCCNCLTVDWPTPVGCHMVPRVFEANLGVDLRTNVSGSLAFHEQRGRLYVRRANGVFFCAPSPSRPVPPKLWRRRKRGRDSNSREKAVIDLPIRVRAACVVNTLEYYHWLGLLKDLFLQSPSNVEGWKRGVNGTSLPVVCTLYSQSAGLVFFFFDTRGWSFFQVLFSFCFGRKFMRGSRGGT